MDDDDLHHDGDRGGGYLLTAVVAGVALAVLVAIGALLLGAVNAFGAERSWPSASQVPPPPAAYRKSLSVAPTIAERPNASKDCASIGARSSVPGWPMYGCAVRIGKTEGCLIYIQAGMPPTLRNAVLRHEKGHCPPNNWPASHPH